MKAQTFKQFINTYGGLTCLLVSTGTFSVTFGADIINRIWNKSFVSSAFLIGSLYTIAIIVLMKSINKHMYKLYQKKLHEDALLMTEQLRMNHMCNPDKLNELIKELQEAEIIKKKEED